MRDNIFYSKYGGKIVGKRYESMYTTKRLTIT